MHDGQLEDRLRKVLRGEGDAVPPTITTAELERRLALRRRARAGRRAGLVAVAVAVVAIGSLVVSTSGWFRAPSVGSGPTAVPTASREPSSAALPCETIDTATTQAPPTLVLGLSSGDSMARQGAVTELQIGERSAELLNDWSRLESFMVEQSVQIEAFASNPDACIMHLNVTYAQGEEGNPLPPAFSSRPTLVAAIDEPARIVEIAPPTTPGDWFMKVRAVFAADPPAEVWTDTVFRITVPEMVPNDEPDCEPVDPTSWSDPPSIGAGLSPGDMIRYSGVTSAYQWDGRSFGDPASWVDVPTELQVVVWPEVEHVVVDGILVADGVVTRNCLYDVRADALLTNTSQAAPLPVTLAVANGVGTNSVEIEPPPVGVWLVKVRAGFATTDGSPAWSETTFRVIVRFDAPTLTMSQGAGVDSRVAEAECPSYQLASGAGAADQCGAPYEPITDIAPLTVPCVGADPCENTLDFTLGGEGDWRIDQARVTAVKADLVAVGSFAPEYSVAFVDKGGFSLAIPILLDPGSWILRVSLNGSRDGDTFGAYYDLPMRVGP